MIDFIDPSLLWLFYILITIIIVILMRPVYTWYSRMNDVMISLEKIEQKLESIRSILAKDSHDISA